MYKNIAKIRNVLSVLQNYVIFFQNRKKNLRKFDVPEVLNVLMNEIYKKMNNN